MPSVIYFFFGSSSVTLFFFFFFCMWCHFIVNTIQWHISYNGWIKYTNHHMNVVYLTQWPDNDNLIHYLFETVFIYIFFLLLFVVPLVSFATMSVLSMFDECHSHSYYIRWNRLIEKLIQLLIFSSRLYFRCHFIHIVNFIIWFQFELAICTMCTGIRCVWGCMTVAAKLYVHMCLSMSIQVFYWIESIQWIFLHLHFTFNVEILLFSVF